MTDGISLIKALLINAATQSAAAVCDNTTGGGVPIDPLIQDTALQGKGVMVYEEAKIQYAALLRAFHDKTGVWPDPKVGDAVPGSLPSPAGLLTQVVGVLTQLPKETPLGTVGQVLDLVAKFGAALPKQPGQELGKV